MAKMAGLIHNELIKIFKKSSTVILFILVIVLCVGFMGIMKVSQIINESYAEDFFTEDSADYQLEIEKAEKAKEEGTSVAADLDIEKYTFMNENEISDSSWKYDVCNEIFSYEIFGEADEYILDEAEEELLYQPEASSEEAQLTAAYIYSDQERQQVMKMIEDNDWKAYCEYQIAALKAAGAGEEEYWEYQYRIDNDIPLPDSREECYSDWQNRLISEAAFYKAELASNPGMPAEDKEQYESSIALAVYRLDNDVEYNILDDENEENLTFTMWTALVSSVMLISIIGLFVVVITGSTVSNEFSQGTIKFLLINPVKRWKILVSKYITSLLIGYAMVGVFYVVSIVMSAILFGTDAVGAEYVTVVNGSISTTSGFVFLFKRYMLASVNVLVMATMAFAISSLLRSSALAIGVSVFALLSGNTVVMFLSQFNIDWGRYLIFANTDLVSISKGTSYFANHSMSFAVGVIIVHMIVFLLTAWDGFTRREV